jgi:hypothetical protein
MKQHFRKHLVLAALALCVGVAIASTQASEPNSSVDQSASTSAINPVIEWNRSLLVIVRTKGAQPATIHSTRNFAILHAAIYEAVSAIDQRHKPYFLHLGHFDRRTSQDAAADAAAHEVLVNLYPSFKTSLDGEYAQDLAKIPDSEEKTLAILVGQFAADAILALRSHDGSDAPPFYMFGNAPGDYQPTPPNNVSLPQFTQWSKVTPFVLARADQFRPAPPPALASIEYTQDFNEVKWLGIENSTTATPEQQQIGLFWNGTIQNYWNEIAQSAALAHKLSTAESARLFAQLNLAMADSVIALYDAKYAYNRWRPVTAIRAADTDNNPGTVADPTWLPEGGKNTAPDPSYPGAHATISAAGAETLILFFGSEQFDQNVSSEALPGVLRFFKTYFDAFQEAAASRVLAGQHFRSDELAGGHLGRQVADYDFRKFQDSVDRAKDEGK